MRQLTGCQVGQETGGRGKGVAGVKTDGGVKKKCEVKMKDIGVGYKGGGCQEKQSDEEDKRGRERKTGRPSDPVCDEDPSQSTCQSKGCYC